MQEVERRALLEALRQMVIEIEQMLAVYRSRAGDMLSERLGRTLAHAALQRVRLSQARSCAGRASMQSGPMRVQSAWGGRSCAQPQGAA